jgi:hypothetical protein
VRLVGRDDDVVANMGSRVASLCCLLAIAGHLSRDFAECWYFRMAFSGGIFPEMVISGTSRRSCASVLPKLLMVNIDNTEVEPRLVR